LWRRPRPKLGCGAKERRKNNEEVHNCFVHRILFSAEVKNVWSYTSTPPYAFMVWCLVKHRDTKGNGTKRSLNMGRRENAFKILVEKPEGRRPLGKPRRR
jgi:hypothetical protein